MDVEADIWIVPLSSKRLDLSSPLTFKDVPFKLEKYFYPQSRPRRLRTSHIGFRYDGRLQFIAAIEKVEALPHLRDIFRSFTVDWVHDPHYCLHLGPLERYRRNLPSGAIWDSNTIYCDWDFLDSSDSVLIAAQLTSQRRRFTL